VTGRWLGFEDARLAIDPIAGTFTGKLGVDGEIARRTTTVWPNSPDPTY
jgi:hypothetical protein